MGTNYYLIENGTTTHKCERCGHVNGRLHIGKSSYGWHFSLHVMPERGINTLQDWIMLFNDPNYTIYDEYGDTVSVEFILNTITQRKRKLELKFPFEDFGGTVYNNLNEYCMKNGLTVGYNGLFRHPKDGHCIGYGDGPYDYIIGEFS